MSKDVKRCFIMRFHSLSIWFSCEVQLAKDFLKPILAESANMHKPAETFHHLAETRAMNQSSYSWDGQPWDGQSWKGQPWDGHAWEWDYDHQRLQPSWRVDVRRRTSTYMMYVDARGRTSMRLQATHGLGTSSLALQRDA